MESSCKSWRPSGASGSSRALGGLRGRSCLSLQTWVSFVIILASVSSSAFTIVPHLSARVMWHDRLHPSLLTSGATSKRRCRRSGHSGWINDNRQSMSSCSFSFTFTFTFRSFLLCFAFSFAFGGAHGGLVWTSSLHKSFITGGIGFTIVFQLVSTQYLQHRVV